MSTKHDLVHPDDEVFRVKKIWVKWSDGKPGQAGKPMPFEARYAAWFTWFGALFFTFLIQFMLGMWTMGWISLVLVGATVFTESLAVASLFMFGVDFDRPLGAVAAQIWRGWKLQLDSLLPSQQAQPVTLRLRATARQERPAHTPWYRRVGRRSQPPAPPTPEAEIEPSVVAQIPKPRRRLAFVGRVLRGLGVVATEQPVVLVVVGMSIALLVFNPWSS